MNIEDMTRFEDSMDFIEAFKENENDSTKALLKRYMQLMTYYRCALMEVETKFNVLNEEFTLNAGGNPISAIKSRIKTPSSIIDKLHRYGCPVTLDSMVENLHDVVGVRVVCTFLEDVYKVADAFLKDDGITLLSRKDYIQSPKKNGYRSLHLIVSVPVYLQDGKHNITCEIQIRTIANDFWASLEHQIFYKKGLVLTEEERLELLQCAEMSAQLDKRMNKLKKAVLDR